MVSPKLSRRMPNLGTTDCALHQRRIGICSPRLPDTLPTTMGPLAQLHQRVLVGAFFWQSAKMLSTVVRI